MSIKRAHVGVVAAIILAAGGGFVAARALMPSASGPGVEHVENAHEEGEHAEGFVALPPADAPAAGVQLAAVERGGGIDLVLPGRVAVAVNAQSVVAAPLDGMIVDIHVTVGATVARGAPIASIRSPEGGAIRADVDAAVAKLEAAEALNARNQNLYEQGVIPRQEWEATRAATLTAQAELRAAQAQAAAMGAPTAGGVATIRSPIAGVVTRIPVTPGSVLDDGMEIATVADASKAELVFDAPSASVDLIKPGARLEARWTGGEPLVAEVIGVAPGLTTTGGTVRARVAGAIPPPGTVVSGRLVGGAGDMLTVPSEAVQTIEGAASVFVVEPEGFRVRAVTKGRTSNSRTEIVSGLNGDEQIAGRGAFLLKAELGKGEAEHDH